MAGGIGLTGNVILPGLRHSTKLEKAPLQLTMGHEGDHIQLLRQLDPQALTQVHETHYARIYRYALQRLNHRQQAEDASSEVFVRLVESLHSGKGPKKNVTGWLFKTASNVINDFYRREYRHSPVPTDPQKISEINQTEAHQPTGVIDPKLDQAIKRLTEDQQQVLALRFSAELSLAETSQIMNKSVNAVKALQFRAITTLRDVLKEKNDEG